MTAVTWVLIAVVAIALIFDFTNGFHDAANAIATSIGTRALRPTTALAMAALLNIVGGVIYPTKVANTITDMVDPAAATQTVVLAALLGAILWNLITWYFGIPSSSSHALIGGMIGAAVGSTFDVAPVRWKIVLDKIIIPTIGSPLIGLLGAIIVTTILYRLVNGGTNPVEKVAVRAAGFAMFAIFFAFVLDLVAGEPLRHISYVGVRPWYLAPKLWYFLPIGAIGSIVLMRAVIARGPGEVNARFRVMQTLSAGYMALEHGHNDAQKTMGIITVALVAGKVIHANVVPLWVKLACAIVIGLGTFSGGRRIIKTMGMKLVKLEPIDGFAAETVAGTVINAAGGLGMPISTTHAITAAITGVGATKRISAVKWGVTGQILFAWILTLPAAAILAAAAFALLSLFSH